MSLKLTVAALVWTVALMLSRALGLVRDAVLGQTLGVGIEADVYAAAFRIPDLLTYVVSGGALSIVFIPMFTRFYSEGDEERAWRAYSRVANFIVVLAAILVPTLLLAMPRLCAWFFPGFDAAAQAQLVFLSRVVLPAQVFHLLSGILSAALVSRDQHAVPALAPLVYNLAIIVGGWVGGDAEGFAWGVLAGSFLGPFLLPLWAARRAGLRWMPLLDLRHPDFLAYLRGALPIMLAFSLVGLDDFAWTHFAAGSPGDVATLSYAKALIRVPIGVFGFAMGMAAYPELSRLYAQGRRAEAWVLLRTATLRALVLALGAQVVLSAAGPEAGTLVYSAARIPPQRLDELAACLWAFALALGPWTVQTLVARGFYARGRTWVPTLWGTAVLLLSLPVYALGFQRLGALGLALASSLAITVYVVSLYAKLDRDVREGEGVGRDILKLCAAAALAVGAGLSARAILPPFAYTRLDAAWRIGIIAVVTNTVFVGVAWGLGVAELRGLARQVARRLPGAGAATGAPTRPDKPDP
ncbi:MAG: murein biosynthesis integral membrane protein MurJ [Deltaproteobacteria bacterium]|nr:murein biosynthesis integral membrane protein MurJ [Deltaproteobacteria bacterium]